MHDLQASLSLGRDRGDDEPVTLTRFQAGNFEAYLGRKVHDWKGLQTGVLRSTETVV